MTRCDRCNAVKGKGVRVCTQCGGKFFVTRWDRDFSAEVSAAGSAAKVVLVVAISLGVIWLIVRFIHWAWETPISNP
jgi:membrane protein YdbS with pleckstrin-like domain